MNCSRLLLPALALCTSLHAGIVTNVTVLEVSSQYDPDRRHATNLVNGSGLYGEVHSQLPAGSMWLSGPDVAGAVTNAYVIFDLGSVQPLSKIKVWNYNEAPSGVNILTRRGIASADILIAGEDQVFTTAKPAQAFTRAAGAFTNLFDLIDMGGAQARYVRFNVITNFGGDNRAGLSEVQFVVNSVQPAVKTAMRSFSGNRVTVQYAEAMDPASATNKANYTVTGPGGTVTISSADLHVYKDAVDLFMATPLATNASYTVTIQNVADAAALSTIANTTIPIGTDLVTWLKADAGVTADASGFVSQWDDQSGNNNHAMQGDPVSMPTKVDNAVTNKPAIHFDGGTQFMDVLFNESLIADRDVTLYIVVSLDLANTFQFQTLMGINNVNIPASYDWYANRGSPLGSPRFTYLRGNGSGNQSFASAVSAIEAGKFYVVSVVQRGTQASTFLNGSFNGSGTFNVGQLTVANSIRLGMRHDNGTRLEGSIAEAMVFRGAVTDAERASIDDYLGKKYGINVVALQINEQPQSVTIESGQTTLFSVRAAAGSPDIRYQWQSNTVAIVGATNSFYKTPFLGTSANNANYRVVVSTPLGSSLTSSNATVTVTADVASPTVSSAVVSTNGTNIIVTFSEPVTSASATDISHFTLDRGANVTGAVMATAPNQVMLTASGITSSVHLLTVRNIADLAAHNIATTTIPVLSPSLALWVRADAGVRIESGGIRQWLDQSPNGNDALQLNAARRPTLTTTSMNNQPSVNFNGTQFIEAFPTPSLSFPGDVTIFAVVQAVDYSFFRGIIGKTLGNQPGPIDYYLLQTTGNPRLYRGNGVGANGQTTGTLPVVAGEPHVVSVIQQSTNVAHFLDGAANGTGTLVTTIADAGTPLKIGNRDDLAIPYNGEIAEVLVFNSSISASERQAIDTYLGVKYFPFSIVTQPQPVTKLEGQSAEFSVEAKAGGAQFTYQWQRNDSDIPGATSASYTTPTLALGNNTDTYRVVISAPGMTPVTSDAAILTVEADAEAPTVVSVGRRISNPNQIVITFSEPVTSATATQTSSYQLNNGATVTGAVMGSSSNEVILTATGVTSTGAFDLTVQNVKDLFNNTILTVTPPVHVYPASAVLWLRADAGIAKDAEDKISQWNDQSGSANHATSVALDNAPLFVTNVWDDLPSVSFDGTNHFLTITGSLNLGVSGDMTVYVVAQVQDYANFRGLISRTAGIAGNIAAPYDYYLAAGSGLPSFVRGDGTSVAGVDGQTAPTPGEPQIISVLMRGSSVTHYLNTQTNGTGTINALIADSGVDTMIGTRSDRVTQMAGEIQEILIFAAALSDADRAEVDGYLTDKYGILASPAPTITATASAGNLTIAWPAPSAGFVLQRNIVVGSSTGWTDVPNPVVTQGNLNTVTVPIGTGMEFFRLTKP